MKAKAPALGILAFTTLSALAAASAPPLSSPYRSASLAARRPVAAGEEPLDLDVRALAALRAAPKVPLRMADFPVSPGARAGIVLRRFEIASPDARIRVTGPAGDSFLPLPDVAHFHGHVLGEPDSTVYVGARSNGLVAFVRSSAGSSYVGPGERGSGFVVRDSASPANDRYAMTPWRCDSDQLPEIPAVPAPVIDRKASESPEIVGFQKASLIVETDQELLAKFSGDIPEMTAYLLSLFAQFNLIYERDLSFHLTVIEIHAWTVADPWNGPGIDDQLSQLGTWYHTNRPLGTYPRAAVHLESGVDVTGGLAYRPALCIADFDIGGGQWGGAYGVSQIFADYPAQDWDLFVTTHEIGHNAGSRHTHCFTPPIDTCYSGETGCYAGPTEVPPGGGTIMSYCHTQPGGLDNTNLDFHERCVDEQILPYVQARTCTSAVPTFPDVPVTNPFFHYVQTIYQLGITGGCAGGINYCPGNPVTRAQMAVFLIKSKYGSAYVPPACSGVFPDVPCSSPFAIWIEKLAADGVTGGCGGGLYCPGNTVTRKQMAPFLLKSLYGSTHVPPPCTGIFTDVQCAGNLFAPFIEELYSLGITGGCVASPLQYCPENANTRAQMAVFLVKTFDLVW